MPQSTTGKAAELRAQRGLPAIEAPQVEDESYRVLSGNTVDAAGMEPLLAVHEIYLAEKNRLIQYQYDITQYREQEKAWKDTHPKPDGQTVFWFKPHRNSRYLTEEDKAQQAAACVTGQESKTEEGNKP